LLEKEKQTTTKNTMSAFQDDEPLLPVGGNYRPLTINNTGRSLQK
jgi:hypothetical protein